MKDFKSTTSCVLNSIFNIGFFKGKITWKHLISRLAILTIVMYAGISSAFAQLNSTSSQTISTNQTYSGASKISNSSTVTISGGTTTFTGSLTVGSSTTGKLVVKSGATVIVNGYVAIGTGSNGSIVVENGGKLIVNPGTTTGTAAISINSTATLALDVQTGGSLIVNAGTGGMFGLYETNASKTSIAGSMQIRGGGLKMDGSSTLSYSGAGNDTIIGPASAGAYFTNTTKLSVGDGVNLYINGNVKNDSNAEFAIDGNVSINGNYQSGNTTANVTGSGTLNTTGSLDADSYQGSVFGQRYSCASGPCAGSNVISSSNTTTCNGGIVNITGVAVAGATYQWLVSTTSATTGFTNISGATNQNYSTTGSSTKQYTYYKRQYTLSGQTYNSNTLTITSSYWTNAATVNNITGSNTICDGGTTTLSNTTNGGTWSSSNTAVATITSAGVVTGVSAGTSVISYTINASSCAASKTVTMTVNAIPTITSTTPGSRCGAGAVALAATASAGTVNWYAASTGGTSIATGGSYSPVVSATTTYYAGATNSGCTTSSRTAVTATINPIPAVFVDNATATICSGSSVTLKVSGDPGKALSFDDNQYIKLNNDPLASATSFTFEAMIYWTDNTTQWQRIFDFGNSTNVNMFFTTKSDSGFPRYAITTSGNGGEQRINTTTSITTNAWHHVAITYNSATTTGIMYIDGVSVGTNTSMTLDPSDLTPKPLAFNYFGESQYTADPNFAGQMDEIRIWDVTRTSAQINANKGVSVDPNSDDLVAYYKLNEGSGTSLTSVSGGGTASTVGSPSWVASTAPISVPGGLTTTYTWSPATGLNTTSGATVVASPTTNQTYTVTATYSNGCSSTATAAITVNATPTITATTPVSRCGSGAVTLGATASAGTINWYTASSTGSSVGTGTSYSTTVSTTTTFYVDATSNGCTTATRTAVAATVNTCTNVWTGATSTVWATASNWSLAVVPTAADDVSIPASVASNRMPTISANTNVKTVTNSGTITMTAAGVLNMYGNLVNNGTFTTVSGSTVSFVGSSAQTITGVPVLYNMVINNTSGGVDISSAVIVKGTLSLKKGVLTTNSNLTINFDNGGNIGYVNSDLGSISGTVSGRRDVIARTHYIAAPFSGVTSAQVQATTPLFVNPYWKMYTKDFATQGWAAVINTTTSMPLGTGFSLSFPAAASLIFTGTYDHTFTLTGESYSNAAATKYFMVGNPYPSTLDWNNASGWTKTNIGGAIYYWDPANNRTASYVSGAGTNGGTQYIAPMQSVLVATTGSGAFSRVSINNNARLSQNSSFFRVAQDDVVRITLISGIDSMRNDETVVRFNELATDTFDFDLDAHKIMNTGIMPSVYTTSGSDLYSVNSYESVDSAQYIPVGAKLPADGAYKLKITGNNPNIEYILVDKQLGIQRSIESDSIYAFNGLRTDDVNRFELQLRVSAVAVPTGIQSANKNGGLNIYSSVKGFVIKTDRYAGDEAEIEILDVTGNSINTLTGKNLTAGSTYVPLDMAEGAYLIRVHIQGNTFAGMIVLTK